MKRILFATGLLFWGGLLALPAPGAEWAMDAAHSKLTFTAESRFFSADGQFRKFLVKADVDEQKLENSKIAVSVDVASLDTNNETRDNHLRSKDFFDAATYPAATINIKAIRKAAENSYAAESEITLRGVTKNVVLPVRVLLFENGLLRFRGETELNRKDFGISYDSRMNPISDAVLIRYEVNLRKPK
jgi:polyisoprenoid-binding protein YceI